MLTEKDTWRNTAQKRKIILETLEAIPDVSFACKQAGVDPARVLLWKARWKSFSQNFDHALREGQRNVYSIEYGSRIP